MVFYRKYRPQKISELDLSAVRQSLLAILNQKEIPHAFLFTGPKGLGKTSSARILAKAINCEKNSKCKIQSAKLQVKSQKFEDSIDGIEPCNECDVCKSVTNGSNIDVLEIDAASNRGVEEIRSLRERIKYAPASLAKKVYIIDEVHMLTTEAFNALLKTLEEPPSHVLFVLCTTEFWKLPATIVSRTFVVNFEKAIFAEMKNSLERVISSEGLVLEDGVLEEIYSLSEGSFRDAVKVLEELALHSKDKKITKENLESNYKVKTIDVQVKLFIEAIAKKDAKEALTVIDALAKVGVDFKVVNEKIVGFLRKLLLKKTGIDQDVEDVNGLSLDNLKTLISYFNESYKELKFSVLPQLPIELVVARWVFENTESAEESIDVQKGEPFAFTEKEYKLQVKKEKIIPKEVLKEADALKDTVDNHTLLFDIKDFLPRLIEVLKKDNHSVAGVLRSCKTIILKDDGELEVVPPYKFHAERLNESKVRQIVEKRAGEILGREVKLSVVMKAK
ncbi:DNA polymerase III subunit gamma/tau [Candidatus Parcubacteria bacterium]|nr:MAG: DNA polymerase III subunit gamma/tau [Candidatus Parcubacteria bacterium]